ncbi:tachykinin-4 [Chionomys nivalis]|uniref:tachykinin-4 n=1 Tax=Chionomys nivalis TaxID=269649 RepID=UPI002595FAC5|nr:tachykinin-4 [Chionomys nivalis]
MLPLVALFLLIGQSVCTTTGDREDLTLSTEAESWMTMNPSIELQLQELKRSRTRQFYGLMGKRVEGIRPIQPREGMGYQLGRIMQDLLGARGFSIEGACRQETHHESAEPGAVAREGLQSQTGRPDPLNHQQRVALSLDTEEDDQGLE